MRGLLATARTVFARRERRYGVGDGFGGAPISISRTAEFFVRGGREYRTDRYICPHSIDHLAAILLFEFFLGLGRTLGAVLVGQQFAALCRGAELVVPDLRGRAPLLHRVVE